ncbi:16S rRNA methyltransferase [Pokkaliibacter plantistimulans]|uniref:16S rRNA (cytosine(967)-C(5))-methyltransferase n=1 Tax=Pokkaliibacter plantistimulans TaxID=1635171 RepID=A0ABX5LYB9_9GAMM|nr:16S rRNA (cytosine(967)-C(5))-methyltransferase RsmB [Pokkaliibacter plantistimulans]PXF29685.1 16S rRNA methyltransferase [Pokkaliibacter plantistimulans]
MSARQEALLALLDVLEGGHSLTAALGHAKPLSDPRDQALLQELSYGVLRWQPQLQAIADYLLMKKFKRRDLDVYLIIQLGLYQLMHTRVPSHAAISQTVEICRGIDKQWATGLVNGILRRFERDQGDIIATLQGKPEFDHVHPGWFIAKLAHAWPQHWKAILDANNERPPMTLRVNLAHGSREDYLQLLQQAEIAAQPTSFSPVGLTLEQPVDVNKLPGFNDGLVSVQDEAAQLAAALLAPQAGERLLDACCAPGGKTAHLLELASAAGHEVEVIAMDVDPQRLQRTQETLERLQLGAELVCGDAAEQDWWDQQYFDAILADVPCSATGVIRRHPDIKSLRTNEDIGQLAELQLRILANLWSMLKPGGRLVYATCSVLPQENNRIIERFSRDHDDVQVQPLQVDWGIEQSCGRQLFPTSQGHDGFFYALLHKRAAC